MSLDYASQRSYLDDLFSVYPTIPNGIREINQTVWEKVQCAYEAKDNLELVKAMLELELFPIKDSYVAYMKRDKGSLERNPRTVNRIASQIMQMDLSELYKRCSEPKETNRQIGPMFKKWVNTGVLGFPLKGIGEFCKDQEDAVLMASDAEMKSFAEQCLGYSDKDSGARRSAIYKGAKQNAQGNHGQIQRFQYNERVGAFNILEHSLI